MVYLTRKEHFNAAHRLFNPQWSNEQNASIFGKCANEHYHGHNYNLFVTVKGEADPQTGLLVNAKELSLLINKFVIDKLDHKNLNLQVSFLKDIIPSTENLTKAIWQELESRISGCTLHSVRLFETENIYVEYYGE